MHNYELTYRDGKKLKLQAEHIGVALYKAEVDLGNVVKVECIDKALLRSQVHEVNFRLHSYGTDYHDAHTIMPYIREILAVNGFDTWQLDHVEVSGQEGEARCVDIGRGVYLCVTWYRMHTGRYEVVAYIS